MAEVLLVSDLRAGAGERRPVEASRSVLEVFTRACSCLPPPPQIQNGALASLCRSIGPLVQAPVPPSTPVWHSLASLTMNALQAAPPAVGTSSGGLGLTFAATRCACSSAMGAGCVRKGALPTLCDKVSTTSVRLCRLPVPAPRRLEEVYLVYTSEKNRGLTLRLHSMLIVAWAVGAVKTAMQCLHAHQQ